MSALLVSDDAGVFLVDSLVHCHNVICWLSDTEDTSCFIVLFLPQLPCAERFVRSWFPILIFHNSQLMICIRWPHWGRCFWFLTSRSVVHTGGHFVALCKCHPQNNSWVFFFRIPFFYSISKTNRLPFENQYESGNFMMLNKKMHTGVYKTRWCRQSLHFLKSFSQALYNNCRVLRNWWMQNTYGRGM